MCLLEVVQKVVKLPGLITRPIHTSAVIDLCFSLIRENIDIVV